MDAQYVKVPSIDGMKEPIMQLFEDGNDCKESFWWPMQKPFTINFLAIAKCTA